MKTVGSSSVGRRARRRNGAMGRSQPKRYALTAVGRIVAPAAVVALPCGWVLGGAFSVLAATLGLSLAVATFATRRRVEAVLVGAPPALRATVGEPLALPLDVTHAGGPRVRDLALRVEAPGGGTRPAGHVPSLRHGELVRTHIAKRLLRRGAEHSLDLELATSYPLGLVEARRRVSLPADLLGLPRVGRFGALGPRRTGRALQLVRTRLATRAEEEPAGVREHRQGEPARRIHWRASARREELVLRSFEVLEAPPLRLILALQPHTSGPFLDGRASFEGAVSLIATLSEEELRNGRGVALGFVRANASDSPREERDELSESTVRSGRTGLLAHLVALAIIEQDEPVPVVQPAGTAEAASTRALRTAVERARRRGEEPLVVVAGGAPSSELGHTLGDLLDAPVIDVDDPDVARQFQRSRARLQPLAWLADSPASAQAARTLAPQDRQRNARRSRAAARSSGRAPTAR